MKRVVRRFVAFVMITVIMSTIPISAFAFGTVDGCVTENVMILGNDVRITGFEDESGNTIICEYVSGVLKQRNTIPCEQIGVAFCEYFDDDGETVIHTDYLYASDYGEIQQATSMHPYVSSGYSSFGSIQYKVVTDTTQYYTQIVKIRSHNPVTMVYTIRNWTGTVVNLVTALVSAKLGTYSIMNKFLNGFLASLGIGIIGNKLTSTLSATVASERYSYTWQLYDSVIQDETFCVGDRYYISDEGEHYGETYYDGVTPKDWGTGYMATMFYNAMYSGDYWNVHRWLLSDGNGYV